MFISAKDSDPLIWIEENSYYNLLGVKYNYKDITETDKTAKCNTTGVTVAAAVPYSSSTMFLQCIL
jgi:hypothetical protein